MPLLYKICILLVCGSLPLSATAESGIISELNPELAILDPAVEETREEIVERILQMAANAGDICAMMMESAQEKGPEAQQIAADVRDQYAQRLTELAEMDYSDIPEQDLGQYIDELSDIIAAFREASDAIEALS